MSCGPQTPVPRVGRGPVGRQAGRILRVTLIMTTLGENTHPNSLPASGRGHERVFVLLRPISGHRLEMIRGDVFADLAADFQTVGIVEVVMNSAVDAAHAGLGG